VYLKGLAMITLSALGDEIDPDLDVQMDWVEKWGLRFIDVRAIDGLGITKMTVSQARQYRQRLTDRGLAVPCVCSPVGKTPLEDAFAGQLELLRHCFDIARAFQTNQVRIFSFYPSPDRSLSEQRGEVVERLRAMVDLAAEEDMVLLHENVRGVYGAKPATRSTTNILLIFCSPYNA